MTSLMVVSDSTVLGMGFDALAAEDASIRSFGRASPSETLARLEERTADVVILDLSTDEDTALRICESISRRWPPIAILVLAVTLDDHAVRRSIEAGARGFLSKDADPTVLRSAIEMLAQGHAVLDPRVTRRVIEWATRTTSEETSEGLSSRELEVLRWVSRGEPNKRIAKRMGLTENTVKTYLRRAYRKLDVHTRSSAAAAVAQRGLI